MAFSLQAGAYGTLNPALPADVVAGDLLLCFFNGATNAAASITGWTQIHNNSAPADGFYIFSKTAGSSESAPTITSTVTGPISVIIRVRGWDPAGGPAQITAQTSTTDTASIDPPNTGALKIGIVHTDPTTTSNSVTWATATKIAERDDGSAFAFFSIAHKTEDTAGALSFTFTGTAPAIGTTIFSIAPSTAATPVADFTATPLTGAAPVSVAFTDTSTNVPTSWLWDFGDGSTSTSQNPSHSYTTSGVFTVSLTATNVAGSNTKTRTAYITVSETIAYAAGGGISIW